MLPPWTGPEAVYVPNGPTIVISNVSFAGSPPSTTRTAKVQLGLQVPENWAVLPATVNDVIATLLIDTPAARSWYTSEPLIGPPATLRSTVNAKVDFPHAPWMKPPPVALPLAGTGVGVLVGVS